MAGTEIRGRTDDRAGALVFGVMTAVIDVSLLAYIWCPEPEAGGSGQGRLARTSALLAVFLLGSLLGAAVSGRRATPWRRRRFAATGALTAHLLLPALLVVAMMIHPPTFV